MKKFYSALVALLMLPFISNATSNMAYNKTGRTTTLQSTEERLIVSDRVINPNEAVKNVEIQSGSYSVGTWINMDQNMSLDQLDNNQVVMSYTPSHHINTNGVWSVCVDSDGNLRVLGYGKYIAANSATDVNVPLNEWNHVMFVYDDEALTYSVYLNGDLAGEWAAQAHFNWLDENPVFNFAGWQFSGSMDEVQIYNRALSAEEVAAAQASATDVDGLAALYTLDEVAEGTTGQFANLVEGGENYSLTCQTITAKQASGSYIWSNGIPFVESSSESSSTYATVAESAPALVDGREMPEATFAISIFANGEGTVKLYTDADLTNEIAGDEITASACPDGLYIVATPAESNVLETLYVNEIDVTEDAVNNVYHLAALEADLSVAATFSPELAGIEEVAVDLNAADVEYFNLQGIRVAADNLTSGVYVARQGDKTMKVSVKK